MITRNEALKVLNENILNFWHKRMIDPDNGGFYGRIDGHGTLHKEADKGVILNTRLLWTFSAAFGLTGNPRYKLMADLAYEYLVQRFIDPESGGVFWMLDYKGGVVNDKKQVYAQAFAIYALAEYHKINPYRRALDHAKRLFERVELHSFDTRRNGYFEAFDRSWGKMSDVRLSEKDMNATKTMNTHLHVLEAYTNLYRVWPDSTLRSQLINLIKLLSTTFLYQNGHFKLFFEDNWNLLSHEFSYGHDIEGSWLLCEAAEVANEERLLKDIRAVALKMVAAALEGLDKDGGLMNEGDQVGFTDTDKHWWPQAEALVGLINAFQITEDSKYLKDLEKVWTFTKENLMDPDGEWYWKVSRDGMVSTEEDKAGPWKGPYHNGRAMIELYLRLV